MNRNFYYYLSFIIIVMIFGLSLLFLGETPHQKSWGIVFLILDYILSLGLGDNSFYD